MVEAMVALTMVDHLMMQQAQCELFPNTESMAARPNPMGVTAVRPGGPNAATNHIKAVGGDGDVMVAAGSGSISQRVDEE
jgi:hypothetical protein